MDDIEFRQRAYANPTDQSEDFLVACNTDPQKAKLVAELIELDDKLKSALKDACIPENLKQRLMSSEFLKTDPETKLKKLSDTPIDSPDSSVVSINALSTNAPTPITTTTPTPITTPTRKKQAPLRMLATAACLVLAIGLGFNFLSKDVSNGNKDFENEIFAHLYEEINHLDAQGKVTIENVNQMLASFGGQLDSNMDVASINVKMAADCQVALKQSLHLVMEGEKGAITVFIIPNSPVSEAYDINDERFNGIISPTPMGNIVVLGEKNEPIDRYMNLIASNISWNL